MGSGWNQNFVIEFMSSWVEREQRKFSLDSFACMNSSFWAAKSLFKLEPRLRMSPSVDDKSQKCFRCLCYRNVCGKSKQLEKAGDEWVECIKNLRHRMTSSSFECSAYRRENAFKAFSWHFSDSLHALLRLSNDICSRNMKELHSAHANFLLSRSSFISGTLMESAACIFKATSDARRQARPFGILLSATERGERARNMAPLSGKTHNTQKTRNLSINVESSAAPSPKNRRHIQLNA
jgi:hypothetical protein